jgi:threonylcarbamoyladenosine tRNA methylthiotransferase MtaB
MDRKSVLRVAMATLGCKTNQSDSTALATELAALGHERVPLREVADVYIIHTCTVTGKTDYQSRQLIRKTLQQNPQAQIIVTGCYAQVSPSSLEAIPGVDWVVGLNQQGKIAGLISGQKFTVARRLVSAAEGDAGLAEIRIPRPSERTRFSLKIQDGCNSRCSYCIVPQARGKNRSLPLKQALSQIRELSSLGYNEVVLTGIHLGTYGHDFTPPGSLLDLLQTLEEEDRPIRIRLSSIEPGELPASLVEFLAGSKKVCPHLHIPLQSGDDAVLQRMNRHYSSAFFEELIFGLIAAIPDLAIGADVIGGFPGEDERAFERTLNLVERLPIAYLHVFPYSRRSGTPAASMPDQIPEAAKRDRCRILRELGQRKREDFYRGFLGERVKVLVESRKDRQSGLLKGYSRNYIQVLISGENEWINREIGVEVVDVIGGRVFGKVAAG